MNKHTPGPWYSKPTAGDHGQHLIFSEQSDAPTVAVVYNDNGDADIIAAAPELLAALEDLRASVQKWAPQIDQSRARYAIAKAKGTA